MVEPVIRSEIDGHGGVGVRWLLTSWRGRYHVTDKIVVHLTHLELVLYIPRD